MIEKIEKIDGKPLKNIDPLVWIKAQANKKDRPFFLAFCDDGVVWGGFVDNRFQTSEGMQGISPKLSLNILHQAYAFGAQDEIRLFKDETGAWQARCIDDVGYEVIVESQVLWGSRAYAPEAGFTRVFDARQHGLDHIVPLEVASSRLDPDDNGNECLRLEVHHLVESDAQTGEARIALSRLAGLSIGKRDLEVAK